MQSENTAGASTETENNAGESEGIASLGDMLALDEPGEQPGDDAGASGEESGSEETKPTKFNDLAGKLGLELDDLYKLEISQAEDGTPVTVENLKDYYAEQANIELRETEFEERRIKQEADLMKAQDELREIIAALPERAVKPEVLQKVREKHDAQMKLERKKTLDVIPEWADDERRTKDIEKMSEHLQQYGYPVNYLERVADHRMMKYIRDSYLREQRIRAALAKVKAGKPNPTKPSRPNGKGPSKRPLAGVKRGNTRNKLEAVFSQLD